MIYFFKRAFLAVVVLSVCCQPSCRRVLKSKKQSPDLLVAKESLFELSRLLEIHRLQKGGYPKSKVDLLSDKNWNIYLPEGKLLLNWEYHPAAGAKEILVEADKPVSGIVLKIRGDGTILSW